MKEADRLHEAFNKADKAEALVQPNLCVGRSGVARNAVHRNGPE